MSYKEQNELLKKKYPQQDQGLKFVAGFHPAKST